MPKHAEQLGLYKGCRQCAADLTARGSSRLANIHENNHDLNGVNYLTIEIKVEQTPTRDGR
jgi:hypothetical protein